MIKPFEWRGDSLNILDQTALPDEEKYILARDFRTVVEAIKELKVRGAPAIGIAAAYGIALGALSISDKSKDAFDKSFNIILDEFSRARPTAVNLFRSIDLMQNTAARHQKPRDIATALISTAKSIQGNEEKAMKRLSQNGAAIVKDSATVLTHCNTGTLATGVEYGTALGVIKAAAEQGKQIKVFADETRPLLQGSRLTMWELQQLNIDSTLITDSMAGYLINNNIIDLVIVGADRIASNGDTANKIGTYSLAVLAAANHVPFYIAAPLSSIDLSTKSGLNITIEQRDPEEVLCVRGNRIAPHNACAANPAFDVTPGKYIAGIITEKGIIGKPYISSIKRILTEVH